MRYMVWLAAALLALAGCSNGSNDDSSRQPLTQRQRDSILARSPLPGASVVGRALNVSDQQAERADDARVKMDSLFH